MNAKHFLFAGAALFAVSGAALAADSEPRQVQIESRIVETSSDHLRDSGFRDPAHNINPLDHQTANVLPRAGSSDVLFGPGIPQEFVNANIWDREGKEKTPDNAVQNETALQLTPTVTTDGQVRLDVAPVQTQSLQDETAVIGGLVTEEAGKEKGKVPFLSDVPLLGALFKNKSRAGEKKDLLVYVTPHVVNPAADE